MKWEYISHTRGPENYMKNYMTVEDLNKWGQSGWQLISAVPDPNDHSCMIYYFKRPIQKFNSIAWITGFVVGIGLGILVLAVM